jgi:superoxide dismutase
LRFAATLERTVPSRHCALRENTKGGPCPRESAPPLAREQRGDAPSCAQINKDFGSFDAFKTKFAEAGNTAFGSGWAWLSWDGSKLVSSPTPDPADPQPRFHAFMGGMPLSPPH